MNKFLAISILLFIFFISIILFSPVKGPDEQDCTEDNFCKEGVSFIIGNDNIIVSEDSCKKYNGYWDNQFKACHF